jgi:2-methylcitrate dehydratase PrpD
MPNLDTPFATVEPLATLAHWAATCCLEAIPEAVLKQAAVVLCDDLAAMISAKDDPLLARWTEQQLVDNGKPVATVFLGGQVRTDRYHAALINGAAAPWNELDEGSRRVPCHAGIYVLPALLAEAEAEGLSTAETLRCLVVAYEVVTRFARTFVQPSLALHPHATLAAIGAAAAIASARHYDGRAFFESLTSAATLAIPGPFDHAIRGSLMRNLWVGMGAWSGFKAADGVRCGIAALDEAPEVVFNQVFQTECHPHYLTDDLGEDWQIKHGYQKIFPCCQYTHSMIEAIIGLIPTLPENVSLADCRELIVEIHEKGCLLNERVPGTTLSARFSVPHIAAVATLYGRVDTQTLSAASLTDEKVAALRQRVKIRRYSPDLPEPNDRPARVRYRFADGSTFEAECLCAQGSPSTPLELESIRMKVAQICAGTYPAMVDVMDRLIRLDQQTLQSAWPNVVSQLTGGRIPERALTK